MYIHNSAYAVVGHMSNICLILKQFLLNLFSFLKSDLKLSIKTMTQWVDQLFYYTCLLFKIWPKATNKDNDTMRKLIN